MIFDIRLHLHHLYRGLVASRLDQCFLGNLLGRNRLFQLQLMMSHAMSSVFFHFSNCKLAVLSMNRYGCSCSIPALPYV